MQEFDSMATTLYSELVDRLLQGAYRSTGLSLFTRTIKGRKYWYLQVSVGSGRRSHYLGPDTEAMRQTVEKARKLWAKAESGARETERLVSALQRFGYPVLAPLEYRVLQTLAQSGVFIAGAVLVGSHAFQAIGNQLGVRWASDTRTLDIDLASDHSLSIALPGRKVDVAEALRKTGKAFFPVPALDPKSPSTSFSMRGARMRVDLLTPMKGKTDSRPVALRSIKGYATPVRFLDYLLEDIQPAALLGGEGVLVNVPNAARFALHKLAVSARRPHSEEAKRKKDLSQAAQVLQYLLEYRPGDIGLAWSAATTEMPQAFIKAIRQGAERLPEGLKTKVLKHAEKEERRAQDDSLEIPPEP